MKKQLLALSLMAFMVISAGSAFACDGHDGHDDDEKHDDLIPAVMNLI